MPFTWFTNVFPRRMPPARAVAPPPVVPGARPRLLLVEDDWSTHAALRRALAGHGWEVDSASTAAGALAMLDLRPRAVVLDLMLADGEGLEVLRRVRAAGVAARVVVTTGAVDPALRAEAARLAPDALILKPVDVDELLDAVREEA